jgi:hypothetical protein
MEIRDFVSHHQGVAQMARVQGWGSWGREFEPHHSEVYFVFNTYFNTPAR